MRCVNSEGFAIAGRDIRDLWERIVIERPFGIKEDDILSNKGIV